MKVFMDSLTLKQKLFVSFWFILEKKRAEKLDLAEILQKGMRNKAFIKQQLEYIALFSAIKKTVGKNLAISIMYKVMDATAVEGLLLSLPKVEDIKNAGEPFEVFRLFFEAMPRASKKAGCLDVTIIENSEKVLQSHTHWCIWFELAKKMQVPEACIPNCYADDLAFPDYFNALGIHYSRKGTIANGAPCCDFKFEKMSIASKLREDK
ncbi:MAG: L-2-amino-thiazoline-4-carboxylic acid hydrolase [Ignavibacteriales bacterium]|nr:L-2-amino-thiazoline-4-carboxylic acid hydrolase [Ignavibacteriales bacterium]